MADKWVQNLTQLAGEYQQESASGKATDKGKFIQTVMQMANEMTDDEKQKQMIGMAEGFAGKIYGFDPNDEETESDAKPASKPPPKKRPPGKPSYLIPKKDDTKKDGEDESSKAGTGTGTDNDTTSGAASATTTAEKKEEEPNKNSTSELSSQETTATKPKPKPKKRPPGGKPSYLIPKKETETPPSTDDATETETESANDKEKDNSTKEENAEKQVQEGAKETETDEEIRARKRTELMAKIAREDAEIARLEKLANDRAEAREKLEAEAEAETDKKALKTGAVVAAGLTAAAATAAIGVASHQTKKKDDDDDGGDDGGDKETKQELFSLPSVDSPPPSAPPAAEDTEFYSVVVPQGIRSGMNFKVDVGGTRYEVTCPPNVGAGEQIRVELPKAKANQETAKSKSPPKQKVDNTDESESIIYVVVPTGISAGMPFRVAAGGKQFAVACPSNASAGQKIAVKVPVDVDSRGRSRSPKPKPSSPASLPSSQEQEHYVYVHVPPNIHPGMTFTANVNGKPFRVVCPPNTKPGMRIKIKIRQPSRSRTPPPPSTAHTQFYNVKVPTGVTPGKKFKIWANGEEYWVVCPPNVVAGQTIRVPIIGRNKP